MSQRKSPPDEWVNVSDHAVTLASGRPLDAYGGRGRSDMEDPHDRALRDAGLLTIVPVHEQNYHDLPIEQLGQLAEARELAVEGSGKDGNVLKRDIVVALEAADAEEAKR